MAKSEEDINSYVGYVGKNSFQTFILQCLVPHLY